MMKDKYQKILEKFEIYYPSIYKQAVDWWASGRMFITVKLADGNMFEFNPLDNSIRRIRVKECEQDESVRRKEFGSNLEKLIPLSGMTKGELAARLGITNAMLSRYLRGTSIPSVDKAYQIANIIGCRVEELFDNTYSSELEMSDED